MYFFTDLDNLTLQTADQAFGPLATDGDTNFRVTNKFRLKQGAKAYMPLRGQVLVYPQNNDKASPLVNVVIRVVQQPKNGYTPVSYIVYRSILKSSILTTSEDLLPKGGPNDLVNRLWENWEADRKLPKPRGQASGPTNDALGWEMRYYVNSSAGLSTAFTNDLFPPTFLDAGQVVGVFDHTVDAAIDIVLAEPLMIPTLAITYGGDNILTIPATVAAANVSAQSFEEKTLREKMFAYLDVSTFYALGDEAGGITYWQGGTRHSAKDQETVYKTLLKFCAGRNTIYLDLRNEESLSLNHYNEYRANTDPADTPLFWLSTTASAPMLLYAGTWRWPLYRLELPSGPPVTELRLAFTTARNPDPLVYREYGTLGAALSKRIGKKANFISLYDGGYSALTSIYSKEIAFALPLVQTGTVNMCSAIKLMVVRRTVNNANAGNGPVPRTYLDNVFGPIESLTSSLYPSLPVPRHAQYAKRWISQRDFNTFLITGAIVQPIRDYNAEKIVFTASVIATYTSGALDDGTKPGRQISSFGEDIMTRRANSSSYDLTSIGAAWEKTVFGPSVKAIQLPNTASTVTSTLNVWGGEVRDNQSFTLTLTLDEYNKLLTQNTVFNPSIGAVYCYFQPLTAEATTTLNPVAGRAEVLSTTLLLGGVVGNGYQVLDGNQVGVQDRFYSVDYQHFNTEASGASAALLPLAPPVEDYTTADYVADLRVVDQVYAHSDQRLDQAVTRQRVHFYGYTREDSDKLPARPGRQARDAEGAVKSALKSHVFNLYIEQADYWEQDPASSAPCYAPPLGNVPPSTYGKTSACRIRQMYATDAGMSGPLIQRLAGSKPTLEPDNLVRGLHRGATRMIDPGNHVLDIGHALYTLDALFVHNPITARTQSVPTPSEGFRDLGLTDGVDLATFMGDLIIATGEAYDEYFNSKDDTVRTKQTLHDVIDRKYFVGTSLADLYSDADGYGLHETWVNVFKKNPLTRLPDLIAYYYSNTGQKEYSYRSRWKIACLRNNFITVDEANKTIYWMPDKVALGARLVVGHNIGYLVKAHNQILGSYIVSPKGSTGANSIWNWVFNTPTIIGGTAAQKVLAFSLPLLDADRDYMVDKFLNQIKVLLQQEQSGWIIQVVA
jgi:hypothetical protein